jgi:hypothetical protein
MKKAAYSLICCLAAAALTSCGVGRPTADSTGSVWENPYSSKAVSSYSAALTVQSAAELAAKAEDLLKSQAQSAGADQVKSTAELIAQMEVYRGDQTACGKYILALSDAYQCVYGFYLRNSTAAMMESRIEAVSSAYAELSDEDMDIIPEINVDDLRRAANSFNFYGSQICGEAQSAKVFEVAEPYNDSESTDSDGAPEA